MIAILCLLVFALIVALSPARWWCRVFDHRPAPGCTRMRAIAFLCERCHRVVPGERAPEAAMTETRRQRALFAARLHVRSGTMLTDTAVHDIAAELLATREEADRLALDNERLRARLDVKTRPVTIDPEAKK